MSHEEYQTLLHDGLDLDLGIEARLWNAANGLRANAGLKSSEYATPVLGLIFLRYASNRFTKVTEEVEANIDPWVEDEQEALRRGYIAACGFYLPPGSRFDDLLNYSVTDRKIKPLRQATVNAMTAIEENNEILAGTLPKKEFLNIDDDDTLADLLREFSTIPVEAEGDLFGRIYEYFLGKFALSEGQKGGEFFTPTSIVKLIVEVLEPYAGRILDPSCGSGGMFVQSAKFIKRHQANPQQLSVYGQEKTGDTVNLAKMNLAVNGLNGDIRNVNSYYDDPFELDDYMQEHGHGKFDYVLANPPFNVKDVVVDRVKNQQRFIQYGLPPEAGKSKKNKKGNTTFGNANYLWANFFASALTPTGRAGFVMANSASDARGGELEIRKKIIEENLVDVILTVGPNFFLSVTLPITVWFYDRGKPADRRDKTLFLDARDVYTQVTRSLRTFTQCQLLNLTSVVWRYRGNADKAAALIDAYTRARTAWYGGTAAPDDYPGLDNATLDLLGDLETLRDQLKTWWTELENPPKDQPEAMKTFEQQLATLDPINVEAREPLDKTTLATAYRTLEDLTNLAERQLKPKGDKSFGKTGIKIQLRELRDTHRVWSFVRERVTYFERHLKWHRKRFPDGTYADVEGLCKVATQAEIEAQNWSLNPGRYVGVALEEDDQTVEEFRAEMDNMNQEFSKLSSNATSLTEIIQSNLKNLLNEMG